MVTDCLAKPSVLEKSEAISSSYNVSVELGEFALSLQQWLAYPVTREPAWILSGLFSGVQESEGGLEMSQFLHLSLVPFEGILLSLPKCAVDFC